jgi:hypothetical protein
VQHAHPQQSAQSVIGFRNPQKVSLSSARSVLGRRWTVPRKTPRGLCMSIFFQTLKHRAREYASVILYCSVTAYLHQQMTCYCDSSPESSWMEGFPDRELTNFPNAGGAWKGIQCCVLLFRRSETHRFSQFCQNSMGNTQVLCFLILCAEDVDPDKALRCYPWSRFGGQGLCERCQRCIQGSSVWHARVCCLRNFQDAIFAFLRNSK